jgi:hypothetical protein
MTDPEIGPDDEQDVRRLLAEAGGPVRTPADVRERLDRTLAELVATRHEEGPEPAPAGAPEHASVADIGARRRRRWPALAAAAAAVLVAGYAMTVVVRGTDGDADSTGAEAESQTDAGGAAADRAGGAAQKPSDQAREGGLVAAPDVTAAFRAEAGTVVAVVPPAALRTWALGSGDVAAANPPDAAPVVVCATPPTGPGEQGFRVRFRGAPATMVLGPVSKGRRVAVVYGCGAARPLDATVLRAR